MIICGFFSIPAMIATVGNSAGVLDALVGVHVAEQDVVVGVELRRHGLEADRRAAGADLDVDAGVGAAGDERAGDGDGVVVDRVAVADHLVDPAVLGLGVPVGLDDDGLRAVGGQVDAAAGALDRSSPVVLGGLVPCPVPSCRRGRGRRSPPRRGAVAAVVGRPWPRSPSSSSSPPQAASTRTPASGRASQRRVRRMCMGLLCCVVHADGWRARRGQPLWRVDSCQRPMTSLESQPKNKNTAKPSSDDRISAP